MGCAHKTWFRAEPTKITNNRSRRMRFERYALVRVKRSAALALILASCGQGPERVASVPKAVARSSAASTSVAPPAAAPVCDVPLELPALAPPELEAGTAPSRANLRAWIAA